MKTGLVLEGGGLRGIFSAGVMDVLMEEGIEFDGAIGVSAGAAFGCNYKSRQPRRSIRYNLKYAKDPRYSSVRSLFSTGDLFNAQFCYHEIPEKLDPFDWKTFRENPMEFYLVCTDVETGKPVYHLCDKDGDWEMLEWFRASGSMPVVSRVVEVGGHKLLDGGISDSIPLKFMEDQGYERNVVILTRPANYVKEAPPMMGLVGRALQKYPATVEAMSKRHIVYNETLAYIRQRENGKFALVIRPEEDLDIGRVEHDRYKIRETYKAGRKAGRRNLTRIRSFLANAKKDTVAPGTRSSIIATSPSEAEKKTAVVKPAAPAAAEPAEQKVKAVSPAPVEPVEVEKKAAAVKPVEAGKKAAAVRPVEVEQKSVVVKPAEPAEQKVKESASAEAGTKAVITEHNVTHIPAYGRRHRRAWKPGNMTALKQRSKENGED